MHIQSSQQWHSRRRRKCYLLQWISRTWPWTPSLTLIGALVNCISETDNNKVVQMSPKDIVKELEPTPFKLQVANGDIGTPIKTIILQFEIGDWNFKETFIVAKWLTSLYSASHFSKTTAPSWTGMLHFLHLTYSIETDEDTRSRKLYKVQVKTPLIIPPGTTQTITAYTDMSSTKDTTGVINPATNHCSGDSWS